MKSKFTAVLCILLVLTMLLSACSEGSSGDPNGKDDQTPPVSDHPNGAQDQDDPAETSSEDLNNPTGPDISARDNEEAEHAESTPEPEPTPEPVITREGKNGTYMYNVYDDAFVEIVRYTGPGETNLVIPETIEDLPVTRLGDSSIKVNKNLFTTQIKSVTLPNTLEYIGDFTFAGLYDLETIHLPESLIYIGENAFQYTSIADIDIPKGVQYIGNEVFLHTPFVSEFKDEFLIVGDGILLQYCGSDEDVCIPDGVKVVGAGSFQKNDVIKSVVIPESVTKIWMGAFFMSSLESVSLPDSITEIESYTFHSTQLKEIRLPTRIKKLENSMFVLCKNLTKIVLPAGLKTIGDQVFNSCAAMTDITIPNGVTKIGDGAFAFCDSLDTLKLPSSVLDIGYDAIPLTTTIEAPAGSYAIGFAIDNGYAYVEK